MALRKKNVSSSKMMIDIDCELYLEFRDVKI